MRLDLTGWAREAAVGDHRRFVAIFERADALGFDGVWFSEFHFDRHSLRYPSSLLLGAEIFARTERLRFGTAVLLITLQHPLLLAEQVAQLDYQSGGRLDLGVGKGSSADTFAALGIDEMEGRERFAEALRVMRDAWMRPAVSASGGRWTFSGVSVGPPPVQKPHPPLYIAAYTPETVVWAADNDLPLLFGLEPPETRQIAVFRERLAGRDMLEPLRRSSLSRYVVVAPTAAAATDRLETLIKLLDARRVALAVRKGVVAPPAPSMERFLAEQAIAGDPEACLEQLAALVRVTGAEGVRCVFNGNGVLSDEQALAGMELFAKEVLPTARGLSAD